MKPAPFDPAALPAGAWRTTRPVRFADCDPAGIVFFPRYFEMLNGVVEEWFSAALGLDYAAFIGPRRTGLGPAHAEADFFRPGRHGDVLAFAVLVPRIGGSSVALEIPVTQGTEPVFVGRLSIVTTSLEAHRAVPLPPDLRAALARYREGCR